MSAPNPTPAPAPGAETPKPGIDLTPEGVQALAAALSAALAGKAAEAAESVIHGETLVQGPSLAGRLVPRMVVCLLAAVALAAAVALISPQQIPVAAYKLALVTMAGYLGYWLDRWCFPYARPDSFLSAADWRAETDPAEARANHPVAAGCEAVFAAAMLRRALIMLGTMLAMGLGL